MVDHLSHSLILSPLFLFLFSSQTGYKPLGFLLKLHIGHWVFFSNCIQEIGFSSPPFNCTAKQQKLQRSLGEI